MNEHPTTTPLQRAKMVFDILHNPCVRHGEYERFARLVNDDNAVCNKCISENKPLRHQMIHSPLSRDHIAYLDTHLEGSPIRCTECGREIEAHYGDPGA